MIRAEGIIFISGPTVAFINQNFPHLYSSKAFCQKLSIEFLKAFGYFSIVASIDACVTLDFEVYTTSVIQTCLIEDKTLKFNRFVIDSVIVSFYIDIDTDLHMT